ncbi:MAG: hypothetical protein J6M39_00420 [Lachnospiraceae bacterium]|nr:hypothetical protein [Lachnospiraceae bacterium]
MNKDNIFKIITSVLIAIVLFIIFRMTSISDTLFLFADYCKLKILKVNEVVNIKKEPIREIEVKEDVKGLWKSEGFEFEKRYEALIDSDSIIIYKYENENKYIYWVGTFNIENDIFDSIKTNNVKNSEENKINTSKKILSKNYKQIAKYLSTASQRDIMEFTFNDNTITFTSQYNDDFYEVKLKPCVAYNDRIRMVKYNNERVGIYDEKTNKELQVGKYKISYPMYFDNEEENSRRNIPDSWVYNDRFQMNEKNLIIFSPSNKESYAELFIGEYANANISTLYELYDMIIEKGVNYNYNNSELVTFAFDYEKNSIMYIFTTKYVDEYTGEIIYGLAFENWMLMKDTNEIIIIGVTYSNDDASEYDYIGDYEKVIKSVEVIK